MKKILLFDDQKARSERLLAEFPIHEWEIVVDISHSNPSKDWSFIWDYACIILHRSSFSDSLRIKISEKAKSLGKCLVFFSGNYSSVQLTEDRQQILTIYDRQFYQHLPAFAKTSHEDDTIELRVLAFGTRYILEEGLRLQRKLLAPLFLLSGKELLPQEVMEDSYIMELMRLQRLGLKDAASNEESDTLISKESLIGLTTKELRDFIAHQITLLDHA